MPTRVYKYGLRAPTYNADVVGMQMRAGHNYKNSLIEIERGRRAAVRREHDSWPEVAGTKAAILMLDAEVKLTLDSIKAHRAKTHKRNESPAMRTTLRIAKERVRHVSLALRVYMTLVVRPRSRPAVQEIDARAIELGKSERAQTSAYWGTYLLMEDAVSRSRKDMPLIRHSLPNDPNFRRWSNEGSVSAQLQGGLHPGPAHDGSDTRLQIIRQPRFSPGKRGGHRALLRLRVGSVGRAPIWAEWPMTMHRPFPNGAVITRATVHRRLEGRIARWTVDITITVPEVQRRNVRGVVAINCGWRALDEGLRVGYTCDDQGNEDQFVLPEVIIRGLRKSDELRSLRARLRDAMQAWLLDEILDQAHQPGYAFPEWFKERVSHLHLWRSAGKFRVLARQCRQDPLIPGSIQLGLEWWRYRDEHLLDWEAAQRRKSLGRRKHLYRAFARTLADRYRVVVLDNADMRQLAKRRDEPLTIARRNRQMASGSELRECIADAFGPDVAVVSSKGITITCTACGHKEDFDRAAAIRHTCPSCDTEWDQDANAAINMLRRYRERTGGGKKKRSTARTDKSTKSETTWMRRKKKKEERLAKEEEAARQRALKTG